MVAAKIAERAVSVTTTETGRHPGGRPAKSEAPREAVAKALGVSEPTLRRAESHVAAVEVTPALAGMPQAKALRVEQALKDPETRAAVEAVPDGERRAVVALIAEPGAPDDGPRRYVRRPQEDPEGPGRNAV